MKQLTAEVGTFGPFTSIETLADRYRCDGAEYQFSVIGDATIEDYVAPPPVAPPVVVPQSVTMRQARLALYAAGLLNTVQTAITSAGQAAVIEWEYAQEVQRNAGLVPQMASALGMTEAQIDDLFIAAALL